MTFREWNARSCRLADALTGPGPRKGDRIAVPPATRAIDIMPDADVPRTATGKVQHRILRNRTVEAVGA